VVAHLISGCRNCRTQAAQAWGLANREEAGPTRPDSSATIARVAQKVAVHRDRFAEERAAAPALLEELLKHPPLRRFTLVKNRSRLRSYALVEALLARCQQAVFDMPTEAIDIARLAQELLPELDPSIYGSGPIADLNARAWGCLGHAQRAASRLSDAESSLERADAMLEEGTGDPLEEAQILYFRSILLLAQRRLPEGLRAADRALARYRRFGSHLKVARVMLGKAMILSRKGELDKAIRTHQRALAMFQVSEDQRMALAGRHNLIWDLHHAGRVEEALSLLSETLPLYYQLGDRVTLLKLRWVEGQLLNKLGRADEAIESLEAARSGLIEAEIAYEAAMVAFDLAAIHSDRGQTGAMKQLAAEMLQVFQALQIPRETIAAWLVFREAAEAEAVTATLLAELATYFEKAAKQPGLKFRSAN
jgi:tetratricopeptide (TPR) repeat protein